MTTDITKEDIQWLKNLKAHQIKGSWDDMQAFKRMKQSGHAKYVSSMYGGHWMLTDKGRSAIQ